MVSDMVLNRVLNTPEAQRMRMNDKQDASACGDVDRYNKLFSVQSIQNSIRKSRAKGGLNGDHIKYVLKQAGLPTDGSVPELRSRIKDNLTAALRPFTSYRMYPRTDLDKLITRNEAYKTICDRQQQIRERQLVAEQLVQLGPKYS